MWTTRIVNFLTRILKPASWGIVLIGGLGIVVIMGVTMADITLRMTISKVIQGNIDIISLFLVLVFFSGYAYAEMRERHVRVDVVLGQMPIRIGEIITNNGYFLSIVMMAVIAWQYFSQAMALKAGHYVTGMLGISRWPFVAAAGFFLVLFVLALIRTFLNQLGRLLSVNGTKVYLWLLPGIMVTLGILIYSIRPSLIAFEISRPLWGGILFLFLFGLIFLKVHVGVVMAVIALVGMSYISGPGPALRNLSMTAIEVGSRYSWCVAPMFTWMGLLVYHAGFAKELYETAYKWVGHIPGGLASASVAACAGLAAIVGGMMTGVLTMGSIALPQMRAYKYSMKLSTATICTASTIGALIPPSMTFIIYGMMQEISIGKLFIAGLLPGILFTLLLMAMITAMCFKNPKLGPRGPVTTFKEKVQALKAVWAVGLLIVMVLGGLYTGFFTPTEAGAVGCFGSLTIGFARRRLNKKILLESLVGAVDLIAIIMFIFVFATAFSHFIALTMLANKLSVWIIGLGLSPYAVIALILFIYMILGCIMNSLPAVILTLPILYPIAMAAGFDPIWFGVLVVVMVNLGQITPPIGMNVFAMAAIAKDVPMYDIFRGIVPFWGAFIVLTIILVIFPQICLFLPNLMG